MDDIPPFVCEEQRGEQCVSLEFGVWGRGRRYTGSCAKGVRQCEPLCGYYNATHVHDVSKHPGSFVPPLSIVYEILRGWKMPEVYENCGGV